LLTQPLGNDTEWSIFQTKYIHILFTAKLKIYNNRAASRLKKDRYQWSKKIKLSLMHGLLFTVLLLIICKSRYYSTHYFYTLGISALFSNKKFFTKALVNSTGLWNYLPIYDFLVFWTTNLLVTPLKKCSSSMDL
jgi:hypothetical protein